MVMSQYSIIRYLKVADGITILSLLSGFAAIVFFSHGNFSSGSLALFAAAFFDWIDGRVARALGGGTDFGKALDFSDLVSFGVAPAFLISEIVPNYFSYLCAGIFLTASLLRLARFNVTKDDLSFGMPTTFNGIIFPAMYFAQNYFYFTSYAFPIAALVSSALMLSSFNIGRYFPIKKKTT